MGRKHTLKEDIRTALFGENKMEDVVSAISLDCWERAFLDQAGDDPLNLEKVLKGALVEAGVDNVEGVLELLEPADEIREVLDKTSKGTVGIEFPESMHADSIWVAISRFPGGTAVGMVFDSWGDTNRVFVVPDATPAEICDVARDVLESQLDGADCVVGEEADEPMDEDATEDEEDTEDEEETARSFGFAELLANWPEPPKSPGACS